MQGDIDMPGAPTAPRRRLSELHILGLLTRHVHRFRWASHDPFSSSSLYRCSCGVVRPGL